MFRLTDPRGRPGARPDLPCGGPAGAQPRPARPFPYVAIGDSLTAGFMSGGLGRNGPVNSFIRS